MIVASLALVLSLGGVGYAAARIGTKDIQNDAVTSAKIRDGAVNSSEIRDGAVGLVDLDPTVQAAMTVRAWANVTVEATFVAARTKGFATVTRAKTGVYCLTLTDPLLDPATVAPALTVDWDNSSGTNLAVYLSKSAHQCPAGTDLGVRTYSWTAGASSKLANTVAFTIVVP